MMVVALAAIAASALCIVAQAGVLRAASRQHARERDLLINQIMHLAGKTWMPPPSEPPVDTDDLERAYEYSATQFPDEH